MIRRTLLISIFALISACGGPGESASVPEAQPAGASSADIGNHIVHFSAQSTDQLPPAVAREYNIVRSKNRAMLNVSVMRSPLIRLTSRDNSRTSRCVRSEKVEKTRTRSSQFTTSVIPQLPIVKCLCSISASNRRVKKPSRNCVLNDSSTATNPLRSTLKKP